ncbi:hypothetical protein D3C79_501120 [compost metagenome]
MEGAVAEKRLDLVPGQVASHFFHIWPVLGPPNADDVPASQLDQLDQVAVAGLVDENVVARFDQQPCNQVQALRGTQCGQQLVGAGFDTGQPFHVHAQLFAHGQVPLDVAVLCQRALLQPRRATNRLGQQFGVAPRWGQPAAAQLGEVLAALQQPEQRVAGHAFGFTDHTGLPGAVCHEVASPG